MSAFLGLACRGFTVLGCLIHWVQYSGIFVVLHNAVGNDVSPLSCVVLYLVGGEFSGGEFS